jgi:TM2 domain-containing membrane protein YozV
MDASSISGAIKNKTTAGILGILLGDFGIHKFYLGETGMGILYLCFCWTFIPGLVGFIEGIIYLTMSDQSFAHKYGGGQDHLLRPSRPRGARPAHLPRDSDARDLSWAAGVSNPAPWD